KTQRLRVLVPRAGMKYALDEQPRAAERLHGGAVARVPRVKFGETEAIPARPLGQDLREDRAEPGIEIRSGAVNDAVLYTISIGEADEAPLPPARRGPNQECGRRARPLVGVETNFGPRRYASARHHVKPRRQGKKAVRGGGVKQAGKLVRQSPKVWI